MTRQEIIDKLQPIAQKVFAQPGLALRDDLCAANLPTWTSLSFTQFLTEIETVFNIKFKIMEILHMQTMGSIIDATMTHLPE
jgi:acyl carrier protein